jgi:PAS domain S-box-containing protein
MSGPSGTNCSTVRRGRLQQLRRQTGHGLRPYNESTPHYRTIAMPAALDPSAAEALRASEARMRTILDTAVDAFISINSDGIVESFNPAAERMFGYPASEVLGRNVSLLMPSPYRQEHDHYLRRYLATGERKIIGIGREIVAQRKDGTLFPIDLAVGEAVIDGQKVFTGVIRDLTDRKRLEANLLRAQRMETVGTLAGGIAHDLNNVLAVVITAAGNLQLDLPDNERRQVFDELTAAARRGMAVVRQVLSFARGMASNNGPLRPTPVLQDLKRLLRHLLPRSIELQTEFADDLPAISGDEPQLYQVLLNLCVNARDGMPHGGTLTLAGVLSELQAADVPSGITPGSFVVFTVADTGVGIPHDKLETIFEPFYTTKPVGQGTGLGLAMVRDLVRNQGGFVRVASELGKSARFTIAWPVLQPESRRLVDLPDGHGELVLIADSERSSAELARVALETFGYRTVAARDAAEANLLFERHRSDVQVVLLDRKLALDPLTIRAAAPNARLVGLGKGDGCDAAIEVPFTADDLVRAIAGVLHPPGARP